MNLALKRMTVDEFVAWREQQPRGRFELLDGQIIAMNAQRIEHAEIKLSIALALREALKNGSCHVVGDGFSVRIDEATTFEPDALVYCGARLPRGTVYLSEPVLVVEVLSPATKTIDTTRKLEGYFRLASLRHYLIVDPETRTIVHHVRDETGGISTQVVSDGAISLSAVGGELSVAACFEV